jgi:hypothetical protein
MGNDYQPKGTAEMPLQAIDYLILTIIGLLMAAVLAVGANALYPVVY